MNKEELRRRAEELKKRRGRLIARFLDEIVEDGLSKCRKGTLTIVKFKRQQEEQLQLEPVQKKNPNLSSNGYDLSECPF